MLNRGSDTGKVKSMPVLDSTRPPLDKVDNQIKPLRCEYE
jgi:hypothetical protein